MDACASCEATVPLNAGPWCWSCLGPLCAACAPAGGCKAHPEPRS